MQLKVNDATTMQGYVHWKATFNPRRKKTYKLKWDTEIQQAPWDTLPWESGTQAGNGKKSREILNRHGMGDFLEMRYQLIFRNASLKSGWAYAKSLPSHFF